MLVCLHASYFGRCLGDQFHSSHNGLRVKGILWKLKWFVIAFLILFNIQLALNEWLVELELNFGPIKDPVPAVSIPSQRRQFLHPDALQHLASGDLVGLLPGLPDHEGKEMTWTVSELRVFLDQNPHWAIDLDNKCHKHLQS